VDLRLRRERGPLFLFGAAVSYWLLPKAVRILLGFTPGAVDNLVQPDEYLGFALRMLLVFGLSFELPLILVAANLTGVLSGRRIASWWRGMIFGIFVFAAIATPTGGPLTMTALGGLAAAIALLVDRARRRGAAHSTNTAPD
jgi:sec-independent protein translocase protein TatC